MMLKESVILFNVVYLLDFVIMICPWLLLIEKLFFKLFDCLLIALLLLSTFTPFVFELFLRIA